MALTIQKQPENIVLPGNPVELIVSSNTSVTSNHKIHVLVYKGNDLIGEEALPVLNNIVEFNISDYLKERVQLELDILNLFSKEIQSASDSLSTFKLSVFETYDNDGYQHNRNDLSEFKVLQGGLSEIYFKRLITNNGSFYDTIVVQNKKFLTWSPVKKVTWNQHDFLFFIPILASSQNIYARFNLFFSDNTTAQIDSKNYLATSGALYFITTSALAFNLLSNDSQEKKLVKYSVVINNASNEAVSETKSYFIDQTKHHYTRQYVFKNSFGVYDVLLLKGISENNTELDLETGSFQNREFITRSSFRENYSVNSGFIITQFEKPKLAKKYIVELFKSDEIFEIVGKELVPIIPDTKKIDTVMDNVFAYGFLFKYLYAHTDKFYSEIDTEQFFPPRTEVSNVQITNAVQQEEAQVSFTAVSNIDGDIHFTLNWGNGVGTSTLDVTFENGVPQGLQSAITIPETAYGSKVLEISDQYGNKFNTPYTITAIGFNMTTDQSSLKQVKITLGLFTGTFFVNWGDGSALEEFTDGIELQHDYQTTGTYSIFIGGNFTHINDIIVNDSNITGELDLSILRYLNGDVSFQDNQISSVNFPVLFTTGNHQFNFKNNQLNTLDISSLFLEGGTFDFSGNSIESITGLSGTIDNIDLSNNSLDEVIGLVDILIRGNASFNNNLGLTGFLFPSGGQIGTNGNNYFDASYCNISGVIDFNNCNMPSLNFSDNPSLTGWANLRNSFACDSFNFLHTELSGTLDFVNYELNGTLLYSGSVENLINLRGKLSNMSTIGSSFIGPLDLSNIVAENLGLRALSLNSGFLGIIGLNGTLGEINIQSCQNVGYIDFSNITGLSYDTISLRALGMTSTEVDNTIIAMNTIAVANNLQNYLLNLQVNAARTSASDAAYNSLTNLNWSVFANG